MNRGEQAWVRGFCAGLAGMHRLLLNGNDSAGVCRVAKSAAVTLTTARQCDVHPIDLEELRRAGVPE